MIVHLLYLARKIEEAKITALKNTLYTVKPAWIKMCSSFINQASLTKEKKKNFWRLTKTWWKYPVKIVWTVTKLPCRRHLYKKKLVRTIDEQTDVVHLIINVMLSSFWDNQCCGSKYIEFLSGSWILDQIWIRTWIPMVIL